MVQGGISRILDKLQSHPASCPYSMQIMGEFYYQLWNTHLGTDGLTYYLLINLILERLRDLNGSRVGPIEPNNIGCSCVQDYNGVMQRLQKLVYDFYNGMCLACMSRTTGGEVDSSFSY
jgi:hypothetical protein